MPDVEDAQRYHIRLVPNANRQGATFRRRYGEGPVMSIRLGSEYMGYDTYLSLATPQLKELHEQIGAHLAGLVHRGA